MVVGTVIAGTVIAGTVIAGTVTAGSDTVVEPPSATPTEGAMRRCTPHNATTIAARRIT